MTQIATVERILDDTHAEISVPRKSACGHDCEECAGCGVSGVSVYVKALNTVGARPGQKVVVESDTKKMLKIVRPPARSCSTLWGCCTAACCLRWRTAAAALPPGPMAALM